MKLYDLGRLLLLGAIWGASFLFIRIASPVFGPPTLVVLRVLVAGIVLILFAALTKQALHYRAHWRQFLILGALNAAIPFTLIATAQLNLTASMAAILNATTPLFGAFIAAFWLGDALTGRKLIGLALGLFGVSLVVGWNPIPLTITGMLSIGASLLAAFFYGLGGVYSRVSFKNVPPLMLAVGQQMAAGMLLVPLAVAKPPTQTPTTEAMIAVLALAVISTSFAYLIYFKLMATVGATNTLSVTFIVPFFGILWGAIFLGETLYIGQIVGFSVILFSLTLVTGLGWSKSTAAPVSVPASVGKAG